jgi:hypothetical protein
VAIHRRLKEGDERRGKPVIAAGFSVVGAESLRLSPEISVESFWPLLCLQVDNNTALWRPEVVGSDCCAANAMLFLFCP